MPEEFEGDLAGAVFWGADLTGARFRDVNLTNARISHAWLVNVDIDALVENLVINGVDVTAYVNERDPWYPLRGMLRPSNPEDMRTTWAALEDELAKTIGRAQALPEASLQARGLTMTSTPNNPTKIAVSRRAMASLWAWTAARSPRPAAATSGGHEHGAQGDGEHGGRGRERERRGEVAGFGRAGVVVGGDLRELEQPPARQPAHRPEQHELVDLAAQRRVDPTGAPAGQDTTANTAYPSVSGSRVRTVRSRASTTMTATRAIAPAMVSHTATCRKRRQPYWTPRSVVYIE